MTQRLIVIGNGMAGARFVEELLARGGGERFQIAIFGDEPYGNYNRILLSGVLARSHPPEEIFINPLSWYQEHGVQLHAGTRAARIDFDAKVVHGTDGVVERYDKLVIATGARPLVPRMAGLTADGGQSKEGLFTFRTLDDCKRISAYAEQCGRAVVIGGGLLGLEAARGLLGHHLEVHVVHLMGHLMELQLDARGSSLLKNRLEQMGLRVQLGKNTTEVLGRARVEGVRFEGGGELACEMVVISAGIRPNVELARDAGLLVERGIVVGDDLATSARDVYAIGECAQHRGRTYGLVAPCWEQAQVLADRLSGRKPRAIYAGSRIATKLKVMGVDLTVMGAREAVTPADEEIEYVDAKRGNYKKLVLRDGRLAGAIVLGDSSLAAHFLHAFDRGLQLPADPGQFLFPPAETTASAGVLEMADEAQVCNCNGVSKGAILAALRGGKRTLKALCDSTRAGTGCGSCKKDVQALLAASVGDAAAVEDPSLHWYVPGVPLSKQELIREIRVRGLRSVSAVFAALGGGKEEAASKPGLASLLKTIWGKEYADERDARFINDRVHANIQKDGSFSVVPRIYGGLTTPGELRRIAEVAERHGARMVKITGGQRIDLLGFPKEKLPQVWRDLGIPSGHAYTKAFRTCKTCVGTDFCRYGVGDSTALGIAIEKRFQGIESPHKMKLATAGCPRNCSEATTKDLGAVAIEGGKWELYVGGAAGSRVRKGDVLCVVDTHEEVLRMMGRFMQYYREHARYLERTYDFVERIGIGDLQRLLIDDAEGLCAELDAAVQAA
ncbi:MAG TPA: nitrite reductase large subunit NirB, partial [Myxococcaceae bacterium]|nr:nitrite reductase large subunit NirB [Myxococcaceae bacterium]